MKKKYAKPEHHSSRYLFKRLAHYILPYWPLLLLGLSANIIYALIDAGFTFMLKPLFDRGLIAADMVFLAVVPWFVLFFIAA